MLFYSPSDLLSGRPSRSYCSFFTMTYLGRWIKGYLSGASVSLHVQNGCIYTNEQIIKSSENHYVLLFSNFPALLIEYICFTYNLPVALAEDNGLSFKICKLLPHPFQRNSGKLCSYLTAISLFDHNVSWSSIRQVPLGVQTNTPKAFVLEHTPVCVCMSKTKKQRRRNLF